MRTGYAIAAFCLPLVSYVSAQSEWYSLSDSFVGDDFFDSWTWNTLNDPTHGRVNYVDQQTAINTNLSWASDSKFVMRADDSECVPPGSRGRNSIRITSNNAYSESIIILDLSHMPYGCAQWPAFWTLSQQGPWPQGGEIDIIEGVNQNSQNLASLHTTPNCSMAQNRTQTGSTISTNCDATLNNNQGCGTSFSSSSSYGAGFNANNGGVYVMQRSRQCGIKVWFWPQNDDSMPEEVRSRSSSISPGPTWGIPDASFPTDACDYDSHFGSPHVMVFDLTFCGDWAGNSFSSSGCGQGTCADFVDNHPEAFHEAYWEINSLHVYEK